MPAGRTSLDALRRDIDEIDSQIHDLLMRRAEIGLEVGKAKGADSHVFRPGREAQVLRRLLERHQGPFPARVVMRIWREIVTAFATMQGPFSVAALVPEVGPDLAALARDHFGSASPVRGHALASSALRAVTEGEATLAVLPLPHQGESEPWWRALRPEGKARPRIVARLPFVPPAQPGGHAEALVVGLLPPEPSGDDRSYLIVETSETLSRGRLKERLEGADLAVLDTSVATEGAEPPLHFIEVEGFLAEDDPRLVRLKGEPGGPIGLAWSAGSYARPLSPALFAVAGGDKAGAGTKAEAPAKGPAKAQAKATS